MGSPTDISGSIWAPTAENVALVRATLAANVRRERDRRNTTQEALAKASGVGRDTVASAERARHEPRLETLFLFALALPSSLVEMLRGLPGREPDPHELSAAAWEPLIEPLSIGAIVARNIRDERLRSGMTQKVLGCAAGVARGTVAALEAGEREPKVITLIPVAVALDVPLIFFLRGYAGPIVNGRDG